MMTLYPPLESGETHCLQHVAEMRFRLEIERDFRSSMYKKYRRGANVADGIDTALSVTSVGLAASAIGLLSTIIAAPDAIGLQTGAIVCGLLGAGGKLVGRRLQAKARKQDLIRGLAESKLNTIADRISVALNDDKITKEEFPLILYFEVDKYNQMKAEIRGRQKPSGGFSEDEKNRLFQRARDEAKMTARAKFLKEIQAGTRVAPEYFLLASPKPSVLRPDPFKKDRPALNELVQADISTLKRPKASRLYTAYLEY